MLTRTRQICVVLVYLAIGDITTTNQGKFNYFKDEEMWGEGTIKNRDPKFYLEGISSSSEDLARAYEAEQSLLANLVKFGQHFNISCQQQNNEKMIEKIKRTLSEMVNYYDWEMTPPHEHVSNPLNMFLLLKRLVKIWPKKMKVLKATVSGLRKTKCAKKIKFPQTKHFPVINPKELEFGAAMGIVQIERLSLLSVSNFTENCLFPGKLVKARHRLSWEDLELISAIAGKIHKYDSEVGWAEAAVEVARRDGAEENEVRRLNNNIIKAKKKYENVLKRENRDLTPSSNDLCLSSFNTFRPPHWDKNLKCFFLHHFDPFLLLNPFKIEMKNYSPWTYLCHDVFSDAELDVFLSLARGRMYVPSREGPQSSFFKRFYTDDASNEKIQHLTRRLEHMCRLDLLGSGHKSINYQVMNYGIGGLVPPHRDNIVVPEDGEAVQNIATILLRLSTPVAGGNTVFPHLKYAITAGKGSLAVYFNYRSDLSEEHRSLHQACPVAAGHKWVATKSVRWIPQMFKLPCHKAKGRPILPDRIWPQINIDL